MMACVSAAKKLCLFRFGPIAQLGERYNGIVEVIGSIPIGSTKEGRVLAFFFLYCDMDARADRLCETGRRCRGDGVTEYRSIGVME
jgi:hypothetical protein